MAIDCLYSLGGGPPGFALRRFLQMKVGMQQEAFIIGHGVSFYKHYLNFYVAFPFFLKNKIFKEYSLLLFPYS